MKKYAQIIDNETKLCNVGIGTNTDFYKSIGMELLDVEQAYNGQWYLQGYAPTKSDAELEAEQLQADIKAKEQRLADIKDKLLTAVLLDNTDTVNSLKAEYKELLNERV